MHTQSIHRRGLRSPLALACFASPILALPLVAQQTRPPEEPDSGSQAIDVPGLPTGLQAAIDANFGSVAFQNTVDGALWARGSTYKARFNENGATIVPFFGSDAPRNFPLELRVSSATLGGQQLDTTAASCAARIDDDTVRLGRVAFFEEYDLTTKTLEQRFVFNQLPGNGDLVLRLQAVSELEGSDQGRTLHFENDIGSIDYGEAFAIDARGRKIDLDSRLIDGVIELTVPASFVDVAALPLVIDPLITAHTASSSVKHDILPDVSYDASSDRWCIVWANVWSVTDHDVYARLATGAYQLLPGTITIDFSSDSWTQPKIANNNFADNFLAVCTVVPETPGPATIQGLFIVPSTEIASPAFPISPLDGVFRMSPDVGGDPYLSASSYCVVWQRHTSATNIDIESRTVSASGALGAVIPLESSTSLHEAPSISNSFGRDINDGTAAWTVVWQNEFNAHDHDIYAAQLHWDGTILRPMFPVATTNWDETNPAVSTVLDSTGFGVQRKYMILFERDFGDSDVIACVMQNDTVLKEENLVGAFDSTTWFRDQTQPAVDSDGVQFLMGFTERANSADPNGNVYVSDYFVDGTELDACELRWNLAGSVSDEQEFAVHSKASSGGSRRDYLGAYEYVSPNNGYDVIGALWQGCGSMVSSVCEADGSGSMPCPCGNDGADGHGCGNTHSSLGGLLTWAGSASVSAGNAQFDAFFMPPNVPCLFFQGTSLMASVPFGNGLRCVSGVTTRLGLKACDGNGEASYPHAGDPSIADAGQVPAIGGTRYYQAWYRDPSSTCAAKRFNLTNALKVIWTP